MAPNRKSDLATLALRALLAGTLACFMTACVAGKMYYLTTKLTKFINISNIDLFFLFCRNPLVTVNGRACLRKIESKKVVSYYSMPF